MMRSTVKGPCRNLRDFIPEGRRCNFLLFGSSGAGKSSLVNNISSNRDHVVQPAKIRAASHGQCTKKIKRHSLNEYVAIYDSWGWVSGGSSTGKYSEKAFEELLIGGVEDGHDMNKPIYAGNERQNERIIDCVIFVYGHVDKHNLKKLNKFYLIAKKYNLPVFVVVTKIDTWYKTEVKSENLLLEKKPLYAMTKVQQSSQWQELVLQIRKDVGPVKVLPIINYTQNDYFTNRVISHAAEHFCMQITEDMKKFFSQPSPPHPSSSSHTDNTLRLPPSRPLNARDLSSQLFHSETAWKLTFSENIDRKNNNNLETVETFIDGGGEETFTLYDVYYNVLQLGFSDRWRFFVVDGSALGFSCLFGLWNPDKRVFFESMNINITMEQIRKSFNNRSVRKYCFLDDKGSFSTGEFHDSHSSFVTITLVGGRVLTMKKRGLKNYQVLVLNKVQDMKQRDMDRNYFIKELKLNNERREKVNKRLQAELKVHKEEILMLKKELDKLSRMLGLE